MLFRSDLSQLATEARNPATAHIDELDTLPMLELIHAEDRKALDAVRRILPDIARAVECIAERLSKGGRLFYLGAGTSGRLGVLDASECPPTYGTPPELVQQLETIRTLLDDMGIRRFSLQGWEADDLMGTLSLQGAKEGVTPEMARTNIDIGGPCMVRASAKNYLRVASVTDPGDYLQIAAELKESDGTLSLATRYRLMKKAFAHTAAYDTAIADFFTRTPWADVEKTYVLH